MWTSTAGAWVSVLAPSDCRACGGPLLQARRFAVCDACMDLLCRDTAPLCTCCGERLPLEEVAGAGFSRAGGGRCDGCMEDAPPFVQATAFGAYDGTLRQLIRLHKFEGMQELAAPLGARLAQVLLDAAMNTSAPQLHVIAVPLFGRRRGYNQSAQIADAALRDLRRSGMAGRFVTSHTALQRTRATESQSHLSPLQRKRNVRGAFAVRHVVTDWTVVLVDDVYTTGATAAECARMLMNAGAAAVHVVTLARTQPDRVERWNALTAGGANGRIARTKGGDEHGGLRR